MRTTTTARLTGVAYLGLAAAGVIGHLLIRSQLQVAGDPAATLDRLLAQPGLAQLGVLFELLIVLTQALAALGFFALMRRDDPTAAYGVASFGLANAGAIMVSTVAMLTTTTVAENPSLAPGGDVAATVGLLTSASDAAWTAGAAFFGLWLIPMGTYVLGTGRMPRLLGWALIVGGAGYLLSTLLAVATQGLPSALIDGLTLPATVGEFWMIGYLLVRGIRPALVGRVPEPDLVR